MCDICGVMNLHGQPMGRAVEDLMRELFWQRGPVMDANGFSAVRAAGTRLVRRIRLSDHLAGSMSLRIP
jgi:hypothetical protein